jgi:2-oxoglutarate dehydrogenase E2 component (dihydrolipoamide succinyltransferase)
MIAIKVPPLGESIVEATISRWLVDEGDSVAAGDPLAELETDKITVEVPAPKAGLLVKRLRSEGDVVKVDETLAELDENAAAAAPARGATAREDSEKGGAEAAPAKSDSSAEKGEPAAAGSPAGGEARQQSEPAAGQAPKASPAARKIANEAGIDLSQIEGSGRGGVVSKPDLVEQAGRPAVQRATPTKQAAITSPEKPRDSAPEKPRDSAPAQKPKNETRETREKMSTRRKRIAEHLLEAQHSTAHLTTFNELDMSGVIQLRERTRGRVEKEHGLKLSFMPFFVKAACLALKSHPAINAIVDGDSIVYRHYVNMGIAVASEAGLVVPNIRDADKKSIVEIGNDIVDLSERARNSKLTMDDLTGGTFTITNGGVFGSLLSTPILNYPQSGILGLHKFQDRPVALDGRVEIRPMMYVALSYDHRIVEGQNAVLFLVRLKELLEDPGAMLID